MLVYHYVDVLNLKSIFQINELPGSIVSVDDTAESLRIYEHSNSKLQIVFEYLRGTQETFLPLLVSLIKSCQFHDHFILSLQHFTEINNQQVLWVLFELFPAYVQQLQTVVLVKHWQYVHEWPAWHWQVQRVLKAYL